MLVTLENQIVDKSEKFEGVSNQAIIFLLMKGTGDKNKINVQGFVTKGTEGHKKGVRGLCLWANDGGRMINRYRSIYLGQTFAMIWKAAA